MNKHKNDNIGSLFTEINKFISSVDNLQGSQIIVQGKVVDKNIPIEVNRLSPDEEQAIKENEYIEKRKNDNFTHSDKDSIDRFVRDLLEEKSKEFFK